MKPDPAPLLARASHNGASTLIDTLLALGRMDVEDELELAQTTQRVIELVEFCARHLKHENEFVHPAIEARAPGASGAIAHEHEDHLAHITQLASAAAALRSQPAGLRMAGAAALYRQLALFIAENFQHMNVEETAHNEVLFYHARHSPAAVPSERSCTTCASP